MVGFFFFSGWSCRFPVGPVYMLHNTMRYAEKHYCCVFLGKISAVCWWRPLRVIQLKYFGIYCCNSLANMCLKWCLEDWIQPSGICSNVREMTYLVAETCAAWTGPVGYRNHTHFLVCDNCRWWMYCVASWRRPWPCSQSHWINLLNIFASFHTLWLHRCGSQSVKRRKNGNWHTCLQFWNWRRDAQKKSFC